MTLPSRPLLPIALILASAVTAWLAAPSPGRAKPGATAQEAWEMPKIQAREPAKWVASIKQHKLWGADADTEPAAKDAGAVQAQQDWSIVGVAIQGGSAFALISIGDKPSEQYRVGDKTPDGAKILQIEEDRLHLLTGGKESILEIYRK